MTSERIGAEPEQPHYAKHARGGKDDTGIPRRMNSNGTEGGPYIIPPGAQHIPGKWECATCKRQVKTDSAKPRKGSCKCFYYKRTTTYIDVLQDEFLLKQWGNRNVAWGMAQRPDLVLHAASCKSDSDYDQTDEDKTELNNIAAEARATAGDKTKARIGMSLHKLTHQKDRGDTLGYVPDRWVDDLKAYDNEINRLGIEWVSIESFRVFDKWVKHISECDHKAPRYGGSCECLGVAGTVDRIGYYRGRLRIFDIKGLALTTPLPTPTGWTTMDAVRVGDQVFGSDGRSCTVTLKSDTKMLGTYIVSFSDGSKVVCDSEHIWWTTNKHERDTRQSPRPRSVLDVIATLKRSGNPQHAVPLTAALELPEVELPLDPYLFGVWVGDGSSGEGLITKGQDLFDVLEQDGWQFGVIRQHQGDYVQRSVVGLQSTLRKMGVLNNKHIPDIYLRASREQRLRLLQGLFDTDGTWDTHGSRVAFYSTNKQVALAVNELLLTLGQRPYVSETAPKGRTKQLIYCVRFLPINIDPFRLPRKASKVATSSNPGRNHRIITSIEPGPDVETACIAVDSPNHVYLCGERFIPTHNTGSDFNKLGHSMQLTMYARMVPYAYPGDIRGEDPDEVDLDVGYIIKLPEGQGYCELEPMDLQKGWRACLIAKQVWEARNWSVSVDRDPRAEVTEMALRAGSVEECRILWANALEANVLDKRLKTVIRQRAAELKARKVSA